MERSLAQDKEDKALSDMISSLIQDIIMLHDYSSLFIEKVSQASMTEDSEQLQ